MKPITSHPFERSGINEVVCIECGGVESAHAPEPKHDCPYCGLRFATASALDNHTQTKTHSAQGAAPKPSLAARLAAQEDDDVEPCAPESKAETPQEEKRRLILAAHTIDIRVRKDGRDYWIEGDFLKELLRG